MQIGFDISQTGTGKAGCGYYAHAMVEAMLQLDSRNRFSLFPSFGDFYFDPLMPLRNPYASPASSYGPRHLTREAAARFWSGADGESLMSSLDVVHANNFWCPVEATSTRVVYTFYDLAFAANPAWTTERNRQGCFAGVFRSAVAADWVVAISEASRSHYLATFPSFPAERIRVVYPCSRFADASATGERPASLDAITPGRFWLSVGTIEPRKNQRGIVESYARYRAATREPMPLVLAGGKGWLMDDFQAHLEHLGIRDHVVMTGYVTDAELVWLYRNCFANLYPSLFEGFGLPVLEGMQFGAPTIAANNTSLPEVAGHAAILLDAADGPAWTAALVDLANDPGERDRMAKASVAQAATFSWKASATSLLQLYDEATRSPKRERIP